MRFSDVNFKKKASPHPEAYSSHHKTTKLTPPTITTTATKAVTSTLTHSSFLMVVGAGLHVENDEFTMPKMLTPPLLSQVVVAHVFRYRSHRFSSGCQHHLIQLPYQPFTSCIVVHTALKDDHSSLLCEAFLLLTFVLPTQFLENL